MVNCSLINSPMPLHQIKPSMLKEPKRMEMSKIVIEKNSESAHAYVNVMHADPSNKDIPSEEVIRKMISEHSRYTHRVSSHWIKFRVH